MDYKASRGAHCQRKRSQVSGFEIEALLVFMRPDTCDLFSFAGLRFEAVVDLDLIAGDEPIRFIRHANNGHQLFELGVGHAFVYCRSGMRSDAVFALVRDRDGDINHFFGERIERSGSHDLLDVFPSPLEHYRIVRDRLPEIVDPVRLARRHDVVVNSSDFGAGIGILDKAKDRHADLRKTGLRSGLRFPVQLNAAHFVPETWHLAPDTSDLLLSRYPV